MIKVVNKYKHIPTENDIYIGRGSVLGNPYTSLDIKKTKADFQCESREESIEKFKIFLLNKIKEKDISICTELNKIYKLAKENDVYLICYCSPKPCHGDVIKELIVNKINELYT